MRAADLIARSLEAHGVARAYCVPGESYLALLDALYDYGVEVIVCRHESGAGFMAVAEAKMTGQPAVFMVSRGPGATNAVDRHACGRTGRGAGDHADRPGGTRTSAARGAFQEMDYGHFFGGMAKGVFEVNDAVEDGGDHGARIPSRRIRRAGAGGDLAAGGHARGRGRRRRPAGPFPMPAATTAPRITPQRFRR